MMKVLLVEDSRSVRAYLTPLISQENDLILLPPAMDGREGVRLARELSPDVILMDLELPELDGLSAIREIMSERPCPIVVLSAYIDNPKGDRTFESLQAGAVDVLAKPAGLHPADINKFKTRLLGMIRLMSVARVVRRHQAHDASPSPQQNISRLPDCEAIGIGSSTGGPPVIQQLLLVLPRPILLPIFISQHIVVGFEAGFVQWLRDTTGHRVTLAEHMVPVEQETIFLSPADRHMAVENHRIVLTDPGADLYVPSVNKLFHSMAEEYSGRCAGVLLSGMGEDGAVGMKRLSETGALTAIQSAASCVVNGMPEAARRIANPMFDLDPAELGGLLKAMMLNHSMQASQEAYQ
jgi:two-component system chemotaxis response regulator CheB